MRFFEWRDQKRFVDIRKKPNRGALEDSKPREAKVTAQHFFEIYVHWGAQGNICGFIYEISVHLNLTYLKEIIFEER